MKIELDENLPERLVAVLTGLGHDGQNFRKKVARISGTHTSQQDDQLMNCQVVDQGPNHGVKVAWRVVLCFEEYAVRTNLERRRRGNLERFWMKARFEVPTTRFRPSSGRAESSDPAV